MATTTTVHVSYKFDLVDVNGITLQKVTETTVRNARGRDYKQSKRETEDILTLTPAQVAQVIETGADSLAYVLKDVQIKDGYTVLTRSEAQQREEDA